MAQQDMLLRQREWECHYFNWKDGSSTKIWHCAWVMQLLKSHRPEVEQSFRSRAFLCPKRRKHGNTQIIQCWGENRRAPSVSPGACESTDMLTLSAGSDMHVEPNGIQPVHVVSIACCRRGGGCEAGNQVWSFTVHMQELGRDWNILSL